MTSSESRIAEIKRQINRSFLDTLSQLIDLLLRFWFVLALCALFSPTLRLSAASKDTIHTAISNTMYVVTALLILLTFLRRVDILRFFGFREFFKYWDAEITFVYWHQVSNLSIRIWRLFEKLDSMKTTPFVFKIFHRRIIAARKLFDVLRPYFIQTYADRPEDLAMFDDGVAKLAEIDSELAELDRIVMSSPPITILERFLTLLRILDKTEKSFAFVH